MLKFEPMTCEELGKCAHLAARAFLDYECFTPYVVDRNRRMRFIDAMIHTDFNVNWGRRGVKFMVARKGGNVAAVAHLYAPGSERPPVSEYVKFGIHKAVLLGGPRHTSAWIKMDEQASAPCHELSGSSWYLSLLTVRHGWEGRGIGSRFINECIIPYVRKKGGKRLSLFTNSEVNRRFYEKNGFSQFDERDFEYKGKKIGSWSYVMDL